MGGAQGAFCAVPLPQEPPRPNSPGWHLALQEVLGAHVCAVPDPVSLQPLANGIQRLRGGGDQGLHLRQRQEPACETKGSVEGGKETSGGPPTSEGPRGLPPPPDCQGSWAAKQGHSLPSLVAGG